MRNEISTNGAPPDAALAAFADMPGTLVFSLDGPALIWAHPRLRALADAGFDESLAERITALGRDLRSTRGTSMGQLPLAGQERDVASRLASLSDGREVVIAVLLDWSFAPPEAAPESPAAEAAEDITAKDAAPAKSEVSSRAEQSSLETGVAEAGEIAPAPEEDVEAAASALLAERAAGRASIRFLWQTDAEGRFTQLSPELAALVGKKSADLTGWSLEEVVGTLVLDHSGELTRAMARRDTISAYPVLWAFEGGPIFLRADLSALPIFEPGRIFKGFRGFGVLRPADWHQESVTSAAVAKAEEPAPVSQPSASPAPETSARDVKADEGEAGEPRSSQKPPPQEPPSQETPSQASSSQETSSQEPRPHESAGAGSRPVAFELVQGAVRATLGVQKPVNLRLVETPRKSPSDKPGRELRVVQGLSASEKAAFREIAKALGARPEPEPDLPPKSAAPAGERAADIREQAPTVTTASVAGEQAPAARPEIAAKMAESDEPLAAEARPPESEAEAVAETTSDLASEDQAGKAAAALQETGPEPETAVESSKTEAAAETPPAPAPPSEKATAEAPSAETGAEQTAEEKPSEEQPPEKEAAEAEPVAADAQLPAQPQQIATPAQIVFEPVARRARDILDRIPVGVLVTHDNTVLFANRTLLDLLDYASVADIAARGGASILFKTKPPTRVNEGSLPGAMLLAARDGETIAVDGRVQPIDWDTGPATLTTLRRSIEVEQTQRLKAQELDLRARETDLRELRSILDTATDGIIVIDDRGRILSVNRTAEALFGYDQNEVAGEFFSILFAPESHAPALDYLEGLKSGGVRSVLNDGRDVTGRVRQGGRIPLFMTLGQISEAPERKFCAVLRDLTPWKRSEAELVEAKRAAERTSAQKSDFLAKISHEVRTPLNAIIGFAEVMMEERFGPVGNDRYREYLKDIHSSGGHVISLVNDLLDLSKIEAGRMEMNFASVNVNDVVKGAVGMIQPQAGRGRIVVRTALSGKLPPVVADERSLKQIVLNILSNAVKFTDAGGQVIVSSSLTDFGEVVIRVRDTGIGMTDEEIAQALEPFRQIATSRMSQGTGLGLPLTKALVEANRSSLRITSAKNEGTLVEVTFPPTRVLAE